VTSFVDANVFLRLLVRDDPERTAACLAVFRAAERGEVELVTSEAIIAEIVYVLNSPRLYRLPRADAVGLVLPLVEIRGLRIDHKRTIVSALELFAESNLDFVDCLAVAHVTRTGCDCVISYDRHFDSVPGLVRREP
jgi:predicted nucleic acid-binding protein